jgi:signal transduction histidine kinase
MELMQTNLDNQDFQSIKVDELMWEIIDELADKAVPDQISVEYNLPDDPSKSTLSGNRRLLFIAISNILKNAVKFSSGSLVTCEVSYKDHGIQILISDKGIGIAEEDLKKIFQPFYRAANAMKFQGYGIGLSLTDNIVRLHNGKIKIESKINMGTIITLFFPAT